jgi:hypothetical protein
VPGVCAGGKVHGVVVVPVLPVLDPVVVLVHGVEVPVPGAPVPGFVP